MRVNYVEVEIESVYDKSTARIKLSPDDVAALIALVERLKTLVPKNLVFGGGIEVNEDMLTAIGMQAKGMRIPEYKRRGDRDKY